MRHRPADIPAVRGGPYGRGPWPLGHQRGGRHAGGVSKALAVTSRARFPWGGVLIVAGAVTTVIAAVVGYLWLQRMPELRPVDFGQQVQVTATESTSATIFASTGLSRPPPAR